ncbi:MAG: hypothetical protein KAJ24_05860, partial [Candidatus Aenigmarchaeota archaeon]|nr:hypothetical protein [Candidatus Aenigmarchaeota archaeon]
AKDKSLLPLDVHIITKSEFLEMLLHPSENLGKQIARNHIACHNPKTFYSLLKEGMKHGFNI